VRVQGEARHKRHSVSARCLKAVSRSLGCLTWEEERRPLTGPCMAQRMILLVKQSMMAADTPRALILAVAGRSVEHRPQASVLQMAWRKSELGPRPHGSQPPEGRTPHYLKGQALPLNFHRPPAHRDHPALPFCVALVEKMMYSFRLFHCRCLRLKIASV
jgi:hypothetical protein